MRWWRVGAYGAIFGLVFWWLHFDMPGRETQVSPMVTILHPGCVIISPDGRGLFVATDIPRDECLARWVRNGWRYGFGAWPL